MKIGIFDSGLGGLIIAKAIAERLLQYDYIYLGDTIHLPYGGRSSQAVYGYTKRAVEYLFAQDCKLIIIACNTACASALRKLQQEYLPIAYPDRRILGVIVPTVEVATDNTPHKRIGILATAGTVQSRVYEAEILKIIPDAEIIAQSAPLLVPMIENDGTKWTSPILQEYLTPLLKQKIESLVLACTHYPYLKEQIKNILPAGVHLISQDEFMPEKLKDYLLRHPEIETKLAKEGKRIFEVTDLTDGYQKTAAQLYRSPLSIEKIELH